MKLLSIFKKEEPQMEFGDMTQNEKKNFLANDLIERMIRIEQRLGVSFGGKQVPYYQTQYFKELRPGEKIRFTKYLKGKEKNKRFGLFSFSVVALFSLIVFFRVTGNVISKQNYFSWMDILLVFVVLAVVGFLFSHIHHKKTRKSRMDKHFLVLEKLITKRKYKKVKLE